MSERIIEKLTEAYDDAVADLPLEEAIEVAEGVSVYIDAALMGLREDMKQHGDAE